MKPTLRIYLLCTALLLLNLPLTGQAQTPSDPTITGLSASPNPACAGSRFIPAPVSFTATVGNVSGAYNYTLTNGANNSKQGTATTTTFSQSLTAGGSGSQSFTLSVANANGGTASATVALTVNPLPVAKGGGIDVCDNNTADLTQAARADIPGSTLAFFSDFAANNPVANPSAAPAGNYYVRATSPAGCRSDPYSPALIYVVSFSSQLTINNLSDSYCQNAAAVALTGSPSGGSFTVDGQPATQLDPASLSAGSHTIRYTPPRLPCLPAFVEKIVEIKASPNAAFSGLAGPYCADAQPVTLTPTTTGGQFSGPGVVGNTFTPANAGTGGTVSYSLTVNGCSASINQSVVVNALPTPAITGLSNSYCKDAGAATLSGTPSGGSFTLDGQPTTQLTPASLSVGNHTVRYTVTQNGCTAFKEQTVEIKAAPNATFTGLTSPFCANAGAITLVPTTTGGQFSGPGVSGSVFTPANAGTGGTVSYSLTVNGCSASSSQNVVVNTVPTVSLSNNGPLSASNPTVTLTATGGQTYQFSNGASQQNPPNGNTATVNTTGTYSVTVTSASGCSTTAITTVLGGNSPTVCRGATTTLTVVALGNPVKYEWYKNSVNSARLSEVPYLQTGTATASLKLINVQTSADYYAKVTDATGSVVVYGPFKLTVDPTCRARVAAQESVEPGSELRVTLLSNPLSGETLRAVVRGAAGQKLRVELTDLRGRPVQQQSWPVASVEQVVEWNISQQPGGVYVLQALSEPDKSHPAQRQSLKVIKP